MNELDFLRSYTRPQSLENCTFDAEQVSDIRVVFASTPDGFEPERITMELLGLCLIRTVTLKRSIAITDAEAENVNATRTTIAAANAGGRSEWPHQIIGAFLCHSTSA